jgi:lysine 6-dehydrogenase
MEKRFVILGAGRQGTACGAFLLERFTQSVVIFVDLDPERLDAAVEAQRERDRALCAVVDVSADDSAIEQLLGDADVAVSCVPYFLNERLTRQAIALGAHFCDLGGNVGVVRRQLGFHPTAENAGVTVVPDCGLAPGLLNVLAEYWHDRWTYRSVTLLCGGLPQHPTGPLNYALLFSVHGSLNEYLDDCQVSRGGKLITIPGLSETERIEGLPLPGTFEAFATSGGASLAPELYAPRGIDYIYKTLRYAGHRDKIAEMRCFGFFEDDLRVETIEHMEQRLPRTREDVVIARAVVVGEHEGIELSGTIELVDKADNRFTAMERTTGFSTGIVAAYLAGLYDVAVPTGAYVPFQIVPPRLMIDELAASGIEGIHISPA